MTATGWRPSTFVGLVSSSLQKILAQRFDQTSRTMLREAAEAWRADNWVRFSGDENDCTVQIVFRLLDLKRIASYRHVEVLHEYQQLTPEIRRGQVKASRAKRPDIRLGANHAAPTVIECKRLRDEKPLCDKYVAEGIARFVDGIYHIEPGGLAMMLGYVQDSGFPAILDRVNQSIFDHPSMGAGHDISQKAIDMARFDGLSLHEILAAQELHIEHVWLMLDH